MLYLESLKVTCEFSTRFFTNSKTLHKLQELPLLYTMVTLTLAVTFQFAEVLYMILLRKCQQQSFDNLGD